MTHWTHDPVERARFLDGELPADERAARERDLATDPDARARVERHGGFLAAIARAAQADPEPSELFESRLHRALVADRDGGRVVQAASRFASRGRWRIGALAAAATLVAAVTWSGWGNVPETAAADREVMLAAETFRSAEAGRVLGKGADGGTCGESVASPHRFPLVVTGEASVESCGPGHEAGSSVSVLRRDRDGGKPQGLVTVPWDGRSSTTDVGWTRLGDVVVFDVAIGRVKYYLATRWDSVAGTPSCAACHAPARAANPTTSPHRFIERHPARRP